MGTLLNLCPELVLHRYLAVTSLDSGARRLTAGERDAGWNTREEIAYSPLVESLDRLQYQRDGLGFPGYDEWYVFDTPRELPGEIFHGNFFEFQPNSAQLLVFVNMFAFVLHDPEPYMPGILELFWKQIERIEPESYIGDGRDCLTVITLNKTLLDAAHERLR
ncbi:MAG: hypothetical protein M3Z85_00465 [Acidobacteriota bacterium]|nr:hypothetical protein [Acidobacteriota bacterium]